MIGEGKLTIHRDNIIAAVQEWLDKQWTVDAPVVKDVYQLRDSDRFEVQLESNKSFVGVKET